MKSNISSSLYLRFILLLFSSFAVSSCVTANTETVKGMSDGRLCELLGPAWISTASERDAIHEELKSRGASCVDGQVAAYGSKPADTGSPVRYECYTYDHPAQHVLTLPVAPLNAPVAEVTVMFHGEQLTAIYTRNGLTQLWIFEENLYLQIDPDLSGKYMNFQGAEEGEKRKPEAVFECKKRR
ncbi:MAG: hypothetical protein ACYSW0_11950 [Planctomycetota bacterium]